VIRELKIGKEKKAMKWILEKQSKFKRLLNRDVLRKINQLIMKIFLAIKR